MQALRRKDLVLALTLAALHAAAVWGYTGPFSGDNGRWLHEVERFAQGELPYRDFQWHFPPLALWVVGGAARLLGTNLQPVFVIMSVVAALLLTGVVYYFREVRGQQDTVLLAAAILLAFAYVQNAGAPLPAGAYTPAVPVGALCLTMAAVFFLKDWNAGASGGSAWWLGLFAGLAVLSKHDFWIPAAFLVGMSVWRFRRAAPVLMSGATVAIGVAIVGLTAGFSVLPDLVGGFNHASLTGGRGFPSWERLTVDVFAVALVAGFLATMLGLARRRMYVRWLVGSGIVAMVAGAIHVGVSMSMTSADLGPLQTPMMDAIGYHVREGNPLFRPALGWLRQRVVSDPIPLLLPPLLLIVVAMRWSTLDRSRRASIALLLGFVITLRMRRAFEGTEWFEFLLTLPVILLSAELLSGLEGNELRRFRNMTGGVLLVIATLAYHQFGRGPVTRRHFPAAVIARGTVHWPPNALRDYERIRTTIDSVDPAGTRPLFAFGHSGGWNYFLQRRNPFPFTQDFRFSAFDADSVLATPPSGLLLVDNPASDRHSFPSLDIRLDRWEQPRGPTPYLTYDRPRFNRLREACQPTATDPRAIRVYVCP
jgi:hypothetical protein